MRGDWSQPIAADLGLDVYDIERRSDVAVRDHARYATPGSDGGITLDSPVAGHTPDAHGRLDHEDPISGAGITLEVTSPGLERPLRSPAHFQREVGKDITVRLAGHADP